MSTKEAKNDVAVEKIAENDVVDAKADLKGTKRTADVSIFFSFCYSNGFYKTYAHHTKCVRSSRN